MRWKFRMRKRNPPLTKRNREKISSPTSQTNIWNLIAEIVNQIYFVSVISKFGVLDKSKSKLILIKMILFG